MELVSTGLVCSVGKKAMSACAAMRAGVSRFDDLPYLDNEGELIVGALVPGYSEELRSEVRLVHLLRDAIVDCLDGAPSLPMEQVPLLICVREEERPGNLPPSFVSEVQKELGLEFHAKKSTVFQLGHTAGFRSLLAARELLQDSSIPGCLVAGADSYVHAQALNWLALNDRLKTPENSDGVIPGEAAGAILVRQGRKSPGTVHVTGLGFAHEPVNVFSEDPLHADGLVEAARAALQEAGVPLREVDFRFSDVTGESYGFREQSLVVNRLLRSRRPCFPLWHCSENIGDTGAASGVVQVVVSHAAFHKGYAPGRRAICFTSAVLGDRAAAVLEHF